MAPVAGSAYTYTYATLGEIWAWIIGWDLVLEYAMSCSVVASHWSNYFNEFIRTSSTFLGAQGQCVGDPRAVSVRPVHAVMIDGQLVQTYLNLPAILIMGLITIILVMGIRESATTNAVLVVVKVAVVLFVIAIGLGLRQPAITGRRFPSKSAASPTSATFSTEIPRSRATPCRRLRSPCTHDGRTNCSKDPHRNSAKELTAEPRLSRRSKRCRPKSRNGACSGALGLEGNADAVRRLRPRPLLSVRSVGVDGGGGPRLLRLYRLRLDFDPLRRGHPTRSATCRWAFLCRWLLHRALHPDGGRDHRHGALLQDRHGGSGRRRLPPQGGRDQQSRCCGARRG